MMRTFAVNHDLVHDPASGVTHRAPTTPIQRGRARLDDTTVTTWPPVPPDGFNRVTPASVCWSPIVRCNLHCPQCLDDTTVTELGIAHRRRIATILSTSDLMAVDISGGEPLLLRELPEVARTISTGGRAVSVTTNGWHLARRAAELVDVVDAVRVSLDGPDPARHNAIRGPDSFHHATAGIAAAVALSIPVQIQTVLMRRTAGDLQQMVNLARSLGVHGLTILQMLPIGAGRLLADEALTDAEALVLLDELTTPDSLRVRLRTRGAAGNFTVVRADGNIWRNTLDGLAIAGLHRLRSADDFHLTDRDGTA